MFFYGVGVLFGSGGRGGWRRRVGGACAAYHDLNVNLVAEVFSGGSGHPPVPAVGVAVRRRDHRHGEIILRARSHGACQRERGTAHRVAADEGKFEAGVPGAGTGVQHFPRFSEGFAGRHLRIIRDGHIFDEGQAVARSGRIAGRGRRAEQGARGTGGQCREVGAGVSVGIGVSEGAARAVSVRSMEKVSTACVRISSGAKVGVGVRSAWPAPQEASSRLPRIKIMGMLFINRNLSI